MSPILDWLIIIVSVILAYQGLFTLIWMLYAWEDPVYAKKHKAPKEFLAPEISFTALIPARHEDKVIADTIKAVNAINYPDKLKEVLVICRSDDEKTIEVSKKTINLLKNPQIKLVIFDGYPINKPKSLNMGLEQASNEVITIFDAEDEPSREIYHVVNSVMQQRKAEVVQCGVQLMNYNSTWFSTMNVLEYFFWFKSGLNFFSHILKVTPLGGNTVFFKKQKLIEVGGWDEKCLTEDADIGFQMSKIGAKLEVVYDEKHVTKEEAPTTISGFIRQRTRWDQGFMQIFLKGDWKKIPGIFQKLSALYILLLPELQAVILAYIPFALLISSSRKLPLTITILSYIPLYLLIIQMAVFVIGFYEFCRLYKIRFNFWIAFRILLTFYPYLLLLGLASFRAMIRIILGRDSWEKTLHINAHREVKNAA